MIYKGTLLCLLIAASGPASAQSSRIISATTIATGGSAPLTDDSIAYTYSQGRGGDLTHPIKADSVMEFVFGNSTGLTPYTREIRTFDAGNNLSTVVAQNYSGGTFVNKNQYLYTYANGNVATYTTNQWNTTTSNWDPKYRSMYTYNAAGKMDTMVYQVYSGAASAWNNSTRDYYIFDASGNVTTHYLQTGASWTNYSKDVYTYSGNTMLTSEYQLYQSPNFIPYTHYTSYYNGSGQRTAYARYRAPSPGLALILLDSTTYTAFTGTGMPGSISTFSDSLGVHLQRTHSNVAYDAAGNTTDSVYQTVSGGTATNAHHFAYTYNSAGQRIMAVDQPWSGGAWINYLQYVYRYSSFVAAAVPHVPSANGLSIKAYPLPAEHTIYVDGSFTSGMTQVFLFDALGRCVLSRTVEGTAASHVSLDVSALAPGAYELTVRSGGQTAGTKLLVR